MRNAQLFFLIVNELSLDIWHGKIFPEKAITQYCIFPSNRYSSQKASTNNDRNHLAFEDINYSWIAENRAFMIPAQKKQFVTEYMIMSSLFPMSKRKHRWFLYVKLVNALGGLHKIAWYINHYCLMILINFFVPQCCSTRAFIVNKWAVASLTPFFTIQTQWDVEYSPFQHGQDNLIKYRTIWLSGICN